MPKKAVYEGGYKNKAQKRAEEELEQAATQAKLAEESPTGRQPWERLESERTKPWIAFQTYRDLGPKRTLAETSRQLYGPREKQPDDPSIKVPRARSVTQLKRWMVENNWVSRAVAYDLHLDRVRQETAVTEVQKMVERHIGISGLIQQKAVNALKEMDVEQLKRLPKVVLEYLVEGAKMERLARGEATEMVAEKAKGTVSNEATVSAKEELLRRLESIAKRKSEAEEARAEIRRQKEETVEEQRSENIPGLREAPERERDPIPDVLPDNFDPAITTLFPAWKGGGNN